jgi:hypothetical protein
MHAVLRNRVSTRFLTDWAEPVDARLMDLPADVPGLDLPRRVRGGVRVDQPTASRLAVLLGPRQAQSDTAGQRLEMFHAAGREAEVEGVVPACCPRLQEPCPGQHPRLSS